MLLMKGNLVLTGIISTLRIIDMVQVINVQEPETMQTLSNSTHGQCKH
jgi:hypothetical protein